MAKRISGLCLEYIKIFVVVSCFWITATSTVFVNKELFKILPAPVFITWFQCTICYIINFILSCTGGIPKVIAFPEGSPWSIGVFKKMAILSILFVLKITLSNFCLKYVDVSFYITVKCLTIVFNVIFTWLLLKQTTSLRCLCCCALLISGFCLGVFQENALGTLSVIGTICGLGSSLVAALYSIAIAKVIKLLNGNVCLLTYYNNAYAVFLLIPLSILNGEVTILRNYPNFDSTHLWILMFSGAICGFGIGYFISLQVKVTSPLTHNISSTVRGYVQTVIATMIKKQSKTYLWWLANVIILVSSAVYTRFKQKEMEEKMTKAVPNEDEKNNLQHLQVDDAEQELTAVCTDKLVDTTKMTSTDCPAPQSEEKHFENR